MTQSAESGACLGSEAIPCTPEFTCLNCIGPDPYKPVYVRSRMADVGHMHSEPICAFPDCETYLTRPEMAALQARQAHTTPPERTDS